MPEEKPCPLPGDVVHGHVPDWLDCGFFERALKASLSDPELRVCRCEVRAATEKGENYVSIVYAATVTTAETVGGEQERHLIIKCLPSNKARKLMSNKSEFFRKEVDMYNVVLPEFRRLAPGVDASALPWPRHHWSLFDGERDFLILDDLRVAGYAMENRMLGLDVAQLGAALRSLSKFHAFSYALKLREPEVFRTKVYDLFPETMFAEQSEEMIDVFIRNTFKETGAVVRQWGEAKYDQVVDWMEVAKETATRAMIRLLSPDQPGAVLNHGDFWVNNMLFRNSSARQENGNGRGVHDPEDVKLLDFQISRVCSPAGDLSYLMVTSTRAPERRAHWDTLLQTAYLETFWATLEALGAKSLAESEPGFFTWPWLQSEMRRYRTFALVTCLTTTQVVLAEKSDAPDMDEMTEEQLMGEDTSNPFSELPKGKMYQAVLRDLLDEFIEEGVFQ